MPDERPNIVFILCDNVGWGDFAVYGGSTPTPRIDKLAVPQGRLEIAQALEAVSID